MDLLIQLPGPPTGITQCQNTFARTAAFRDHTPEGDEDPYPVFTPVETA